MRIRGVEMAELRRTHRAQGNVVSVGVGAELSMRTARGSNGHLLTRHRLSLPPDAAHIALVVEGGKYFEWLAPNGMNDR